MGSRPITGNALAEEGGFAQAWIAFRDALHRPLVCA